jgi:hypothetical protein
VANINTHRPHRSFTIRLFPSYRISTRGVLLGVFWESFSIDGFFAGVFSLSSLVFAVHLHFSPHDAEHFSVHDAEQHAEHDVLRHFFPGE